VKNGAGTSVTHTVTVTVVPPPTITSFTAGASAITPGKSTTLTGVFSGGNGTVDNNVGPVTSETRDSDSGGYHDLHPNRHERCRNIRQCGRDGCRG